MTNKKYKIFYNMTTKKLLEYNTKCVLKVIPSPIKNIRSLVSLKIVKNIRNFKIFNNIY